MTDAEIPTFDRRFLWNYSVITGFFILLVCMLTGCTVYVIHDAGLAARDSLSQYEQKPAKKPPAAHPAPDRLSMPVALNP